MKKYKDILVDICSSILAGLVVAFGLHIFANSNSFAPGGISGLASVIAHYIKQLFPTVNINMGYFMMLFNLPLFILASIYVEKKLGLYLTIYVGVQSMALIVLDKIDFFAYKANEGNLIFATIATGVICGIGYAMQIKRHGASGGTYCISALIKHWNPAANIAWLTFIFDSIVVVLVFFLYGFNIEATICTLVNLFISYIVVDYCLQGAKEGYKFEIITDEPEEFAQDIMQELRHGVTEMTVNGMYTHTERYMIVCIIRKRELSKMMKIIRKYPKSFASFSRVNEVFGNFKK